MTVGTGNESGGLYYLDSTCASGKTFASVKTQWCVSNLTWHNRLGHPADQSLNVLRKTLHLVSDSIPSCDVFHKAKQPRNSFQLSEHKTTKIGEIIHLDVWAPYRVTIAKRFRFILTIIDDITRHVWVYLMKSKTEVFYCFSVFFNMLRTHFNVCIKTIRSDNGTKLVNN